MFKFRTEHHLNCSALRGWRWKPPFSVSSLLWLFIQGLCCATIFLLKYDGVCLFSHIVKCSLPLKVHVKNNVLNILIWLQKVCLLIEELAQWLIFVLRCSFPVTVTSYSCQWEDSISQQRPWKS